MDCLAPTAVDLCDVQVGHVETRSPFTLLGTKGMGKGCGTALPAMAKNAIEDALSANNIQSVIVNSHNSPEEIWRTIRSARKETI
jgi:CO/xanthine dehydrogenase Mo-binding subunit